MTAVLDSTADVSDTDAQPFRIDVEPELPRNAIGKIQKQVLRSRYVAPVA